MVLLRMAPQGPQLPPVFIFGCGRSGTTVLGEVLSLLPDVRYLYEPNELWAAVDPRTDFLHLYRAGRGQAIIGADGVDEHTRRRFRAVMAPGRGRQLVEKSPAHALRLGFLEALALDAKYIHIVRDGLDVCWSIATRARLSTYFAFRGLANEWWGLNESKWQFLARDGPCAGYYPHEVQLLCSDSERGAYEWLVSMHEVDRWRSQLGDRLLEIRYPDLTAQPQEILSRLATFAGHPASARWLTDAAARIKPSRQHVAATLELPPDMAASFEVLQARHGFRTGLTVPSGPAAPPVPKDVPAAENAVGHRRCSTPRSRTIGTIAIYIMTRLDDDRDGPQEDHVIRQVGSFARAVTQSRLIHSAASLYSSTIITSVLGFIYWWAAARLLLTSQIGIGAAIISAGQLVASVAVVGLNTLIISELAADRSRARALFLTFSTAAAAIGLTTTVASGLLLTQFDTSFSSDLRALPELCIYSLIGCLSTVANVVDDGCVGMQVARLQLVRNFISSLAKLALLPLLVLVVSMRSPRALTLSWMAGLAISFVMIAPALRRSTAGQTAHLEFRRLHGQRRLLASHHWLNVSIVSQRFLIPVLVAAVLGASANAAYYTAALIVGFVTIIPSHFSTSLFALTPGDEDGLRREVRLTMGLSILISAASLPVFLVGAPLMLHIFSQHYEIAANSMRFMAFTTLPTAVKAHFVAINRVRGTMARAAVFTSLGAALEGLGAALGGALYGLVGVGGGLLLACVLETFFFLPTLIRTVRPRHAPST